MNTAANSTNRPRIVILTTGGTIAASTDSDGQVTSGATELQIARILAGGVPSHIDHEVRPVLDGDSATFGPDDLDALASSVDDALADDSVTGVVVAHGTDTLEETALRLDLTHADSRPVVLTGAQRASDDADPDGPGNLVDAVLLAAEPLSRDLGVLVSFGRAVLQARGLRKWHTTDLLAFARNAPEDVHYEVPQVLARPLLPPGTPVSGHRVDVVASFVGDDGTAADACARAGARGIVVEGYGSGNVAPGTATAIEAHPGVVWVVTTRVPRGEATPTYTGPGGGATLAEKGVLNSGFYRSGQARVLLGMLLAEADAAAPEDPAGWVRANWSRYARIAE